MDPLRRLTVGNPPKLSPDKAEATARGAFATPGNGRCAASTVRNPALAGCVAIELELAHTIPTWKSTQKNSYACLFKLSAVLGRKIEGMVVETTFLSKLRAAKALWGKRIRCDSYLSMEWRNREATRRRDRGEFRETWKSWPPAGFYRLTRGD